MADDSSVPKRLVISIITGHVGISAGLNGVGAFKFRKIDIPGIFMTKDLEHILDNADKPILVLLGNVPNMTTRTIYRVWVGANMPLNPSLFNAMLCTDDTNWRQLLKLIVEKALEYVRHPTLTPFVMGNNNHRQPAPTQAATAPKKQRKQASVQGTEVVASAPAEAGKTPARQIAIAAHPKPVAGKPAQPVSNGKGRITIETETKASERQAGKAAVEEVKPRSAQKPVKKEKIIRWLAKHYTNATITSPFSPELIEEVSGLWLAGEPSTDVRSTKTAFVNRLLAGRQE